MKLQLFLAFLVIGMLGISTPLANAEIIATFEDADSSGVDTYPGVAGDGWLNGWQKKLNGTGSSAFTGLSSNTFDGSDNCMIVYAKSTTSSTHRKVAVARKYTTNDTNYIDFGEDVIYSFDVKLDDLSGMDETNDYITFYDDGLAKYNYTASASFVVGGGGDEFEWFSWYKDDSGTVQKTYTGIDLVEDHIYSFAVTVHTDNTYDLTVVDTTDLNNLISGTVTDSPFWLSGNTVGGYFGSAIKVVGIDNEISYSVDNISIANPVPEPSTMVLLASLLVSLLIWRKNKHQ